MPTLLPFRQYEEHDVLNGLFTWSGAFPVNKGTFVKAAGQGARLDDQLQLIGSPGTSFNNTQSPRWGLIAPVTLASTGDQILGMLLYDGRETDENGEKLVFRPQKKAEMEVFISGEASPIVTKGIFAYSGDGRFEGTVTAGAKCYVSGGSLVAGSYNNGSNHVGVFLGGTGALNTVLVKINCVN